VREREIGACDGVLPDLSSAAKPSMKGHPPLTHHTRRRANTPWARELRLGRFLSGVFRNQLMKHGVTGLLQENCTRGTTRRD